MAWSNAIIRGVAAIMGLCALTAALTSSPQVDQRTVDQRLRLGTELANQGHIERAMIEFLIALRMDPRDGRAYCRVGLLLKQAGDKPRAEAAFRQAIELEPDFAEAHYQLGAMLTKPD